MLVLCKLVFPEAISTLDRLEYNCKADALSFVQSFYLNWECLLSPPITEAAVSLMHLLVVMSLCEPGPLLMLLFLGKMRQVLFSRGLTCLLLLAPLQFFKSEKTLSSVILALECHPWLSPLIVACMQIFKGWYLTTNSKKMTFLSEPLKNVSSSCWHHCLPRQMVRQEGPARAGLLPPLVEAFYLRLVFKKSFVIF